MTTKWVALALSFTFPASAIAGEVSPLVAVCDSCHGTDGVSQWSDMPTIAGISEFVHGDALFAYKDGARPCEESAFRTGDTSRAPTDMCVLTKHMTEAQIEAIASYYAALPFVPATQEFDAALAEKGRKVHEQECARCHSDNGSNPEDDASILKGQWTAYMRRTFFEYAAGTREQPDKMKAKMDPLSDDAVEALVHFYASPD